MAGLTDKREVGMTRWARLPNGINGKPKHAIDGEPFACRLQAWNPRRVHLRSASGGAGTNRWRGNDLAGESAEARPMLTANPADYDVPLIAMWGFYRAKAAGDDRKALAGAVEVMEIAQPHFAEPQLVAAITDIRSRLAGMHRGSQGGAC